MGAGGLDGVVDRIEACLVNLAQTLNVQAAIGSKKGLKVVAAGGEGNDRGRGGGRDFGVLQSVGRGVVVGLRVGIVVAAFVDHAGGGKAVVSKDVELHNLQAGQRLTPH
jgi:hypothetical protein